MLSFKDWLMEYHSGKDTPIGDLCNDATRDLRHRFQLTMSEEWEGETVESLKEFMDKHDACWDSYEVLRNAEKKYKLYLAKNAKSTGKK
jgi:hypothetical protein